MSNKTLKAFSYEYSYFGPSLKEEESSSLQEQFAVVCFTETPIHQIDVLLKKVSGRRFQPEPYGLVFRKEYIRENGGNPVFYVTRKIARPLLDLIYEPYVKGKKQAPKTMCKLLSLVTVCDERNDWHWEREWRIVGNFQFSLDKVYCGLCPEEHISYFQTRYNQVKFIDPYWTRNKILDRLTGK